MRNYTREEILWKLKRKRVMEKNGILIIPYRAQIGIKMWGMIDFLKIQWKRKEKSEYKKDRERKPKRDNIRGIGTCRICNKDTSNLDGFWRFYKQYREIILHYGLCEFKHTVVINRELLKERGINIGKEGDL